MNLIYKIKNILLLFLSVFVLLSSIKAQYKPGVADKGKMNEVDLSNVSASVAVRPMETFGHSVNIINTSQDPIKFKFVLQNNSFFRQLSSVNRSYFLNPKDSLLLNFKLLNVNAKVNGLYTVVFEMINEYDSTDKKFIEFNVEVYDGIDRQFVIQPLNETVLINSETTEFTLPVLFKNLLPESKRVSFVISGQQFGLFQLSPRFSNDIDLPPNDTIINIGFIIVSRLKDQWQFTKTVSVHLQNAKGEMIGFFSFRPKWMFNRASMLEPGASLKNDNNLQAEYYFTSNNRNLQTHEVRIGKLLKPDENGIGFRINYQRFNQLNFQSFTGSYVNIKKDKLEAILGNIYENHELNLFGRGLKLVQNFGEANNTKMEVWAIDQEVNLIRAFNAKENAKQLSARLTSLNEDGTQSFSISSNYFLRPESNSKGHLHFGTYKLLISENKQLSITAGFSSENFNRINSDTSLLGYVIKGDFSNIGNKWYYNTSFIKGSRNYSGQSQGVVLFSAYLGYNIKPGQSLGSRLIKNSTDRPGYTRDAILGRLYFDYNLYEFSYNKLIRNFQFTIRPYFMEQSQIYSYDINPSNPDKGRAYRINTSLSGRIKRFYISAEAEAGKFTANQVNSSSNNKNSTQLSLTATAYNFTVSTQLQNGPTYVTDLINIKDPSIRFYNYTYSIDYQTKLLHRLDFQLNASVIKNASFNGSIFNFNQYLNIELGNGLSVKTNLSYFKFGQSQSNFQVRAGIVKNFGWNNKTNRTSKVTFQLFEDINNDGLLSKGEKFSKGIIVRLDQISLVTDKFGIAQVSEVSNGSHKVSIFYSNSGSQSFIEKTFEITKSTHIVIGIPKQFVIKGKVRQPERKYDDNSGSMAGIRVLFIDSKGNEFITFTNQEGDFEIQLPPSTYRSYLPEVKRKSKDFRDLFFKVDPVKGYSELLDFEWLDTSRKVIIKKL